MGDKGTCGAIMIRGLKHSQHDGTFADYGMHLSRMESNAVSDLSVKHDSTLSPSEQNKT